MKILNSIILIIALISAGIFAFLLCKKVIMRIRQRNLSRSGMKSGKKESEKKESKFAWFFRNGISFLNPVCEWLLGNINYLNTLFNKIVSLLEFRGYVARADTVMSSAFFFILLIALGVSLVSMSVVAGIAVVVCCCVCVVTGVNSALDKRADKLRDAIPDVLRSMGSCFQAGYTLLQTFDHIAKESEGSIKKIFTKSNHILQTGGTIPDSLKCLREESSVPELAFIAVALDVQHQTGGSMKPVLDSAKDMIESRLELLRLLKVQTAQAKLSARVVTILPFALIAVFSLISPNFLAPFFTSVLGFMIFIVACLMQVGGVVLVRKMLKVEV